MLRWQGYNTIVMLLPSTSQSDEKPVSCTEPIHVKCLPTVTNSLNYIEDLKPKYYLMYAEQWSNIILNQAVQPVPGTTQ